MNLKRKLGLIAMAIVGLVLLIEFRPDLFSTLQESVHTVFRFLLTLFIILFAIKWMTVKIFGKKGTGKKT